LGFIGCVGNDIEQLEGGNGKSGDGPPQTTKTTPNPGQKTQTKTQKKNNKTPNNQTKKTKEGGEAHSMERAQTVRPFFMFRPGVGTAGFFSDLTCRGLGVFCAIFSCNRLDPGGKIAGYFGAG